MKRSFAEITDSTPGSNNASGTGLPTHSSLPTRPAFSQLPLIDRISARPSKVQRRFSSTAAAAAVKSSPSDGPELSFTADEQTPSDDPPLSLVQRLQIMKSEDRPHTRGRRKPGSSARQGKAPAGSSGPALEFNEDHIMALYPYQPPSIQKADKLASWLHNPKSPLSNWLKDVHKNYSAEVEILPQGGAYRVTVHVPVPAGAEDIRGVGDAQNQSDAERLACMSAWLQILRAGLADAAGKPVTAKPVSQPPARPATVAKPTKPANPVKPANPAKPAKPVVEVSAPLGSSTPIWDEKRILETYGYTPDFQGQKERDKWNNQLAGPKGTLSNWASHPSRKIDLSVLVKMLGNYGYRVTVEVPTGTEEAIVGIGESMKASKKEAERLAYLSAWLQICRAGLHLDGSLNQAGSSQQTASGRQVKEELVTLSDGTEVNFARARQFVDYYCTRYQLPWPEFSFDSSNNKIWDAILSIDGRKIGVGKGINKKKAEESSYLDVTRYLEACDPGLWKDFVEKYGDTPADIPVTMAQSMSLGNVSWDLGRKLEALWSHIRGTELWRRRPDSTKRTARMGSPIPMESQDQQGDANDWMVNDDGRAKPAPPKDNPKEEALIAKARANSAMPGERFHAAKSARLQTSLQAYRDSAVPSVVTMREQRQSLPVYTQAGSLLELVNKNGVVICMAATGSGKTTQIPQLILDDWISRGEGSKCNVLCTQPRRIAAVSVATRVARERGESVGDPDTSVGYAVRFDAKRPKLWGSITFVTTGVFLKMMQGALQADGNGLEEYSHILVDEVHERDVDTDLTLAVLKRLLRQRRQDGKELRVILMSATIDPSLFERYFADEATGRPAPVIDIPGRSFPVQKHFLDDILVEMTSQGIVGRAHGKGGWVFADKLVNDYIFKEIGAPLETILAGRAPRVMPGSLVATEEPEIPYPLVALIIAYVLQKSNEGHVLVFLPGWVEICRVRDILLDTTRTPLLGLNFTNNKKYELHYLHSAIPMVEQEAVFAPPPQGVQRIILSTNIAETSVTIPDVVYVVDAARVKEDRYDPDRLLSTLVSAWIGQSSLNQRAGRAGRHRAGEYYGVLSKARVERLSTHNVVEMLRTDLSNVVMHVKALNFPGMTTEEVLEQTIEPPSAKMVKAAMESLQLMGALDDNRDLTPLGKLLQHLPIDTKLGKLCLFGSFFKCLDPALTIAALLSARDIFLSPMERKDEALAVKDFWSPRSYKSDVLAGLFAYNEWYKMHSSGQYQRATQFVYDNFLHKQSLFNITKTKQHILVQMERTGVLNVSAGGSAKDPGKALWRDDGIPPALNTNAANVPLLAALVALASQPNFAVRKSGKNDKSSLFRTPHDKAAIIHPQSVNGVKTSKAVQAHGHALGLNHPNSTDYDEGETTLDDVEDRVNAHALYAFGEKKRNVSQGERGATTYLVQTTRLDPLAYLLVGAHRVEPSATVGLVCDEWLPIVGRSEVLDSIRQLKGAVESSMLRAFEGINNGLAKLRLDAQNNPIKSPGLARGGTVLNVERSDIEKDDDNGRDSVIEDDDDVVETEVLSAREMQELDAVTSALSDIFDQYNTENGPPPTQPASRIPTRPGTPRGGGSFASLGAGGGDWRSEQRSKPGTPAMYGGNLAAPSWGKPSNLRSDPWRSRPGSGANTPLNSWSRPTTPAGR